MAPTQPADRNAFLAPVPAADYELFRPHLTSFTLAAGERLQDCGMLVEQVVEDRSPFVLLFEHARA
jgi:hypothetical protein